MSVATSSVQEVRQLQPTSVFGFFAELTQLPRPSKEEHTVLDWLKKFADDRGLSWQQDEFGNLVIRKPGQAGGEAAPTVVVQGHIDMVCEKNSDVSHDFSKDPIQTRVEGHWLKAVGTTLGADNGVGVATALALLDLPRAVKAPPLECLFTLEEEIGLNGAAALDPALVTGRTLVNLDSEDWGVIYIGCAGAGDCTLKVTVQLEPPVTTEAMAVCKLAVSGLQGGHSGLEIHQGRGNAMQLLTQALLSLMPSIPGLKLVQLAGGDKRNAIPREASATVLVPSSSLEHTNDIIVSELAAFKEEYGGLETTLQLTLQSTGSATADHLCISSADTHRLLNLLNILPHGPVKFSHAVPELVETSNNLSSIKLTNSNQHSACYSIVTSTRSSLSHALEVSRNKIATAATVCGAEVIKGNAYAGWAPNTQSPVLQLAKSAVADVIGHEPKVTAIHAGLECGILGERLPGCDMVSYGPTILGAHSPDERLDISTVQPFWDATLLLMSALADLKA
eukprot:jgi/Chrzof1/7944/UNPLg00004.t1